MQATGVDLDEAVQVEFTRNLTADTVTLGASSFQLLDSSSASVAGSLAIEGDELRFDPDANLDASATYTIILGTDILSTSGDALSEGVTSSFTTGTSVGGD